MRWFAACSPRPGRGRGNSRCWGCAPSSPGPARFGRRRPWPRPPARGRTGDGRSRPRRQRFGPGAGSGAGPRPAEPTPRPGRGRGNSGCWGCAPSSPGPARFGRRRPWPRPPARRRRGGTPSSAPRRSARPAAPTGRSRSAPPRGWPPRRPAGTRPRPGEFSTKVSQSRTRHNTLAPPEGGPPHLVGPRPGGRSALEQRAAEGLPPVFGLFSASHRQSGLALARIGPHMRWPAGLFSFCPVRGLRQKQQTACAKPRANQITPFSVWAGCCWGVWGCRVSATR